MIKAMNTYEKRNCIGTLKMNDYIMHTERNPMRISCILITGIINISKR